MKVSGNPPVIKILAPAKINLFLKILKKRSDGYHAIDTLFQNINLTDELHMHLIPSGITLNVSGSYRRGVPAGSKNTVFRAAREVLALLHEDKGVCISLTKNIPCGAGLGGGSSDAAAVIRYLPRLLNKSLAKEDEKAVARSLGADVPFFLTGGCARGRGIGDIIQPVTRKSSFWIVMVYPGIHISTTEVYGWFDDRKILTSIKNIHSIIKSLQHGKSLDAWGSHLYNQLEEGVVQSYPVIGDLRHELYRAGAQFVLMSGSGSVMCAFASTYNKAYSLKSKIKRIVSVKNADVWLVRPCHGIPARAQ